MHPAFKLENTSLNNFSSDTTVPAVFESKLSNYYYYCTNRRRRREG